MWLSMLGRTDEERKACVRDSPWMHEIACSFGNEAGERDVRVGDLFMNLGCATSCVPCCCYKNISEGKQSVSNVVCAETPLLRRFTSFRIFLALFFV